jgi:phosphoglycolate phosphatase
MHRHIVFDLDGTLTDPKVGIVRCINHALKSCGMRQLDESESDLSWVIGPPLRETFRRLAGRRVEDSQVERLVGAYRERFEAIGIFENSLYPGIDQMLRVLHSDRRRELIIATTKPTVYAKRIAEHYGLDGLFDMIIGSELDGRRSSKVELLRNVVESYETSCSLQSYLVIGDRENDILAAREVGLDSVGVLYGYGSKLEIVRAEPTFVVSSVQELGTLLARA